MKLSEIYACLGLTFIGNEKEVTSVSIDSRTLQPGALFVAIVGENFDGHNFIAQAKEKGAIAAIVSHPVETELPLVQVADTRLALGQLAAWHRSQFAIPVIALTGSCGKTTVKEMLRCILAECGPVLANKGTLNNDFGVPLTLLQLNKKDQFAVIEMGANHPGEIRYLTHLAKPTVAFINNIAPAHLAGFGSVEGVAQAKAEIFQGLQPEGTALINIDSDYADWLLEKVSDKHHIITFGLHKPADITAQNVILHESYITFSLITPKGEINIRLALLGEHNVLNALAAAAAAYAINVPLVTIQLGLETMRAVAGRLVVRAGLNGATILDDTYNANPFSVAAGLRALTQYHAERILVMGDMGELGEDASNYHQSIGQLAKELGVSRLYACGPLSRIAVEAFGESATHFDNQQEMSAAVCSILKPNTVVLVKGSRSAKMENIVNNLIIN